MLPSTGYIRIWMPHFMTGLIFGCTGPDSGQNIPFTFGGITNPNIKNTLIASGSIDLDRNCASDQQPEGTIFVSFRVVAGMAINIA